MAYAQFSHHNLDLNAACKVAKLIQYLSSASFSFWSANKLLIRMSQSKQELWRCLWLACFWRPWSTRPPALEVQPKKGLSAFTSSARVGPEYCSDGKSWNQKTHNNIVVMKKIPSSLDCSSFVSLSQSDKVVSRTTVALPGKGSAQMLQSLHKESCSSDFALRLLLNMLGISDMSTLPRQLGSGWSSNKQYHTGQHTSFNLVISH